ncbi:DUF3606 domain-containing protein [Flavobacterium magnum]|uniref:DUF3606 domain-containing protein n=1 Tax=Flavobacterium magnum TaxID=2162713 RepID=A0A2S0RFM3_9FLAO|nr:DUF3606 domain-containing protein [Flavobacterium magnum]AWA30329.1 DUF3606 domain-containing protein [Flavobacterium magnum]
MDTLDKDEQAGYRGVIAVDLDNPRAVAHWMEHFEVTEEKLREAVAGTDSNLVSAIAAYLKR